MDKDLEIVSKVETLKNFIKNKKFIFDCGLIVGDDEKMLNVVAIYFALAINCKESFPCLKCPNCQKILSKNAIEVVSYPMFKDTIIVKDVENFVDSLYKRPLDFDKKIYIFNNIDKATIEAQNKLLKSMEEFPSYVKLIFTACNTRQVLPTILSRTTILNIPPVPYNEFEKIFKDSKKEITLPIDTLYNLSRGNIFDGLNMAYDEKIKIVYDNCLDILLNLDKTNIFHYSIIINKENLETYLKIFSTIISLLLFSKSNLTPSFEVISNKYSLKSLSNIANLIHYSNKKINSNTIDQSVIDNLLIGIMEAKI